MSLNEKAMSKFFNYISGTLSVMGLYSALILTFGQILRTAVSKSG
jgi:hypothetical protein